MEDNKGLQPLLDIGPWQGRLLQKLLPNRKAPARKPSGKNSRAERAVKTALAKEFRRR